MPRTHASTEIDPREVSEAIAASGDAVLIDVREQHEWDAGRIAGAHHVPVADLEERIGDVVSDTDQQVVLYCASGNRSRDGAEALAGEYANVASLRGGLEAWRAEGLAVEAAEELTEDQRYRYSRHLLVPEIGVGGQRRLLDAKILLLGAGGLGSPVSVYLAAAGVGTLGLVDDDVVEVSNLQRQIAHRTDRVGQLKVDSAEQTIHGLNPEVRVVKHNVRLDASNVLEIVGGYDLVVDGTDNFPTRYLLSDASVRTGVPVISASIIGFDGQLTVFAPPDGPCYRCLYPSPPPPELSPTCGANGVLGTLPGTMGLLQATEVVKLVVGTGRPLVGRLLLYDALDATFSEVEVPRDPECEMCSRDPETIADEEMGVFPQMELYC